MYRIDKVANRIQPLQDLQLAELGFTERKHLQEWLAVEPNALGEDLLIIQKEFDGFYKTNERMDLLALDRQQRLVIIENKLNSGRNVIQFSLLHSFKWQSCGFLSCLNSWCVVLTRWHTDKDQAFRCASVSAVPVENYRCLSKMISLFTI